MKSRFTTSGKPAADLTAADVHVPGARWIVVGAGIGVCGFIVWLTRNYTFYFDEWTFIITSPGWTVATYFHPHNEHPAMLLRAVFGLLLHTVGLRSYLPYLAVLLAAHFANAVLLFTLVRRRAGDLIALGAVALLLLPGGGWEDVVWAFQLAWLASVGLGLATLIVIQHPSTRPRMAAVCGLLAASLAFSGIGLVFALAAVVFLLLVPGRRRDLVWLAPAGIGLAVWYGMIGHTGNHPNPQPTPANIFLMPGYALWGLSQSAGGLAGVSGWPGLAVMLGVLIAIAASWWRSGADALAVTTAVALVGFYVVTGLTRAQLGFEQAGSSRYCYVAGSLWLVLLADAARALPWRGAWRLAAIAALLLAWFGSGGFLFENSTARNGLMARQVADYYALASERADPCLSSKGAVDPAVMPAERDPAAYYRAIDMYGDPATGKPLIDRSSYAAGLQRLRRPGC